MSQPHKHWLPIVDQLNNARLLGYLTVRPNYSPEATKRNAFTLAMLPGGLTSYMGYEYELQDVMTLRFDLFPARGKDPWDLLWKASTDIGLEHLMLLREFVLPGETTGDAEYRRNRTAYQRQMER